MGEKVPPKSILLLQETVVEEGETIWTILMNELNKALDKVINENKERGFELEVGRENDKFKDYT
ncbi:transposase [Stygiolobus sp. RP850M]|uniref:transposase n=1 Tax=Stygiolobus sp. RP850M TaxID=3133137 RepID=UPI00307D4460